MAGSVPPIFELIFGGIVFLGMLGIAIYVVFGVYLAIRRIGQLIARVFTPQRVQPSNPSETKSSQG